MPRTIRVFWERVITSDWRNFNWPGVINQNSVVHISASIGSVDSSSLFGPLNAIRRARKGKWQVLVADIVPHGDEGGGGGVEFLMHIGWWNQLGQFRGTAYDNELVDPYADYPQSHGIRYGVVTDITVFDPPESAVVIP